jgi:hypothetical protein
VGAKIHPVVALEEVRGCSRIVPPRLRPRPRDAEEVFCLALAVDGRYVEGFVERCLKRMGEDDSDEEDFLRGIWEEGDDRGFVLETLKDGVKVRAGRPWNALERAVFAPYGQP